MLLFLTVLPCQSYPGFTEKDVLALDLDKLAEVRENRIMITRRN